MNKAKRAHLLQEFAAWNKGVRAAADTRRLDTAELRLLFPKAFVATESFGDRVRRLHQLNSHGICETCERRMP